MPYLSGFEIIDGLDTEIPTMMITADVSPEVRERALQSGVELIAKAFPVDEVLGRIKRMLEDRLHVGRAPFKGGLVRVPSLPSDRQHKRWQSPARAGKRGARDDRRAARPAPREKRRSE